MDILDSKQGATLPLLVTVKGSTVEGRLWIVWVAQKKKPQHRNRLRALARKDRSGEDVSLRHEISMIWT